ncbi:Rieske (2Fe-2S) protein [Aeromicrobium choanae]|uniref:3-phenylpropionate/trans-cinnamate dioxygenase ferredoxin subunit n=1 Tax=Aeromicrobium choanae TaxID=1736691 RepID=A0A1T4YLZ1_9ACTN|nr:non-heme iron oxygenase ferredoxin subunit [Aeromicrobium choanae]SKB02703.1 3-phenylpropionate/trans-cinnamate dioxygenase ferredoxin subunit [Aeromicrobium choanae]
MTFKEVAKLADVPEGAALGIEFEGLDLALVRDGDTVYAIQDWCSHAEIPLSDGDVEGCEIECFLHGSRFDLRTGKALGLPATEPVPVYQTKIEGETVWVDLPNQGETA